MPQKTLKPLGINIRVYNRFLAVFFGQSLDEVIKWTVSQGMPKSVFTAEWNDSIRKVVEKDSCDAFTSWLGDSDDVMIYMKDIPETPKLMSNFVHELSHAVDKLALIIDGKNSLYNGDGESEPRAYLFGYIFRDVAEYIHAKSAPKTKRAPLKKTARKSMET